MKSWTVALLFGWPLLAFADNEVWIDVGSQEEYAAEHLQNAIHIPYTYIARGVSTHYPDKETPIRLYDRDGVRAQQAYEALNTLGYRQVTAEGGLEQLKAGGHETQRASLQADLMPAAAFDYLNDEADLYSEQPADHSY